MVRGRAIVNSSSDPTTSSHGVQEGPGSDGIRDAEMLDKGAVKIVNSCPNQYLNRMFLVPNKDSSFRPVINLRRKPLNQFIAKAHFKMENLAMIRDLLREGDWMASIDLKDTYLSVAIWEEHRKYLSFLWESTMYEFQCHLFRLSSTPRVFTKLLKPVLERLHHQGVRLIMYLDDMLLMAQSQVEFKKQL